MFVNQAFCQTFGYTAEDLESPAFDINTLLDPLDQASTMAFWTRLLEGTASDTPREVVARHKDGSRIHLDIRSTIISYQGTPAVEAILVDITEQRQLRDRVVAHERLRALGEMAGGVAHDFNNVLGAILGRAQLLQDFECEDRVRQGLKIIEKAAQDGAETVKRIQDFTRVRTDTDFDRVDLSAVLEDVLEMTRSRWGDDAHLQGKRIEIVRELNVVPDVKGHISELREAFTNLILNAVDAISAEGTVTIRCEEQGDRVVVSVIDTGEGMPPEVQRRLFDPFFTTKGSNGTGLGMSIVYGIVRRHGATIEVKTRLREGTEFRIEFSAAASDDRPTSDETQDEECFSGSGRILVVDDEPEIRSLVEDILTEAGYEVQTAEDGTRALEALRSSSFEMVITDLGMPDITGWEVAREAREAHPEVALILITGWAAALDPKEVERHGIDRTLRKPFEMVDLLRGVSELLGTRGIRRSA
jgi:PAS domain S-box-containing protein